MADGKLAKNGCNADGAIEPRKEQVAWTASVQELAAKLKAVDAYLLQTTAENLELSMKLDAAAAKSDKMLEELAGLRGERDSARTVYCR